MAHSYRSYYFHLIWSTKDRRPYITKDVQIRLYPYLGAIAQNHNIKLIEIGGVADHVHLLIQPSSLDNFTTFIRNIKAFSSKWVHSNFADLKDFAWQEGSSSFTVSYSALGAVQTYIQNQEEHHKKMTFQEEYYKFLKKHEIECDERFIFG